MSLIRKHGAVLQAWACLDLVYFYGDAHGGHCCVAAGDRLLVQCTQLV